MSIVRVVGFVESGLCGVYEVHVGVVVLYLAVSAGVEVVAVVVLVVVVAIAASVILFRAVLVTLLSHLMSSLNTYTMRLEHPCVK